MSLREMREVEIHLDGLPRKYFADGVVENIDLIALFAISSSSAR